MHSNPTTIEMLAYIRHDELRAEAAQMRLVRQARGNSPHFRALLAVAWPRLETVCGRIGAAVSDAALAFRGQRIGDTRP